MILLTLDFECSRVLKRGVKLLLKIPWKNESPHLIIVEASIGTLKFSISLIIFELLRNSTIKATKMPSIKPSLQSLKLHCHQIQQR